MPRDVSLTMQAAIDQPGSFSFLSKATVYPSNVYFETIDNDDAIPGADAIGVLDNPIPQDIAYDAASGLVTFYSDGSNLKYAVQGDSIANDPGIPTSCKPGVADGKLYVFDSGLVKRYAINFSGISFTLEETITVGNVRALHGLSATECVALVEDEGGFRVKYIDGTTIISSTTRFMFPKTVEWDGSARTMLSLATYSTAAKLGNRVFAYMSSAYNGMVTGIYYDADTETWSDSFTAVPTDLSVSMCEFRISNSFTRNNKIYMVGLLNRTDSYAGSVPYTLIMGSTDGMTFAVDRFCLVTNMGYRFHATVGSDNYLYIANCNRVSKKLSTWAFDGDDLSTSPKTELSMSEIVRYQVGADLSSMTMELKGGDEGYVDHPHIVECSRVVLETGYKTTAGDEYVVYGVFIIDSVAFDRANRSRSFTINCTHEGRWKSAGLSMPFYAEITGVSSTYDSMNRDTGIMYSAPSNARYKTNFWVDFWQSKAYSNSSHGITGINIVNGGGVDVNESSGSHKVGFVLDGEVKDIIGSDTNPEITATSLSVKLYGWSASLASGNPNDVPNLILITTDADGNNEQVHVTASTAKWSKTWPDTVAGSDPVTVTVTGLTVGHVIKNVGMVLQQTTGTKYYPWRVEFPSDVKVPIVLPEVGATWTKGDDGTFTIPGSGLPFVMFSQKPYNAFNFTLAAKFTNSVIGGITGYPVAVGLVGLAKDAANFIVARYDKVSNKAQLAKIRDGAETSLTEVTPSFTVGDEVSIQFSHRDGNFKVYILNNSTGKFQLVIDYDWKAADGYMCMSVTSSLKCGIYGMIGGPMVQTLGLTYGETEAGARSDGIPIAPMEDHTDFPSSGKLRIGSNVYSYTSKIAMPAYVRGPSQLRNQGQYNAPYGNGSHGLQCRDLNWTGSASLISGYLIAAAGYSFISTGAFWQPFITTNKVKQYLSNRAQYYSSNAKISTFPASTSMRVWVTGGFTGISLISGESAYHSMRDWARLELDGTIKCHWFMGAGGEAQQTTIQDLIRTVCGLSGIPVEFPGNFTDSSITVAGETDIYEDQYAEGFDMSFELAAPESFEVRTNIKIKPDNYEEKDLIELDTGLTVKIVDSGSGDYELHMISTPSNTTMFKMAYTAGSGYQTFRFLFHEKNFSLFQCHRWIATVTFDDLVYTQTDAVDINAYHATSVNFLNVVVRDLAELREAVYIDLETDGASAIQSIIQERPVEIMSLPNGGYQVYYEYTRPTSVLALSPESHTETRRIPTDAASDAIIYGSTDVKTLQFAPFAKILGLATKLYRLPDLNVGAVEAAIRMLKKAYQRRRTFTITCRPQLAPLNGERLSMDYTIAGINKNVTDEMIIESMALSFANSGKVEASMSITGREYSA